ncbi:MAG: hypothetical protein MZW92_08950 [Comamonadaceae bacterium]|nr:hypothetical protein [Comamonadaceae bacterium]
MTPERSPCSISSDDQLGVEQHLHGRHAAAGVGAQQALRDDGAQARRPGRDSSVGRASGV